MAWRTLILLVLACLILPGLVAQPVELITSIKEGDAALTAGHITEALALYRQAAAYPQGQHAVLLKIAQAEMEAARRTEGNPSSTYDTALDAWLSALEVFGPSIDVRRGLAETYLAQGKVLAAHEWLFPATGDSADLFLWNQLARAYLQNNEWTAAGQIYAAIAQAEPANSEAQFWAGALLLGTDYPLVQHRLIQAREDLLYSKRADKLIQALEKLTEDTEPAIRSAQLGLAYLNIGEPQIACHHLQAAVDLEPSYAEAWAYLGLAQDRYGEDGRRAIARAIELEPENSLAHSLMGHHWLRYEQIALARQSFIAAWELEPENPMRLLDVASTYGQEGDFYSAEAWYQSAIRLEPDNALLWVVLARFHLDTLHDVSEGGMLAAQRAVALAPEDPAALDILGWAQFLAGDSRLAEVNLLAARDRNRSNPTIGYHLARLYEDLDNRDTAKAFYREVVTLDTFCHLCPVPRHGQYAQLAERALTELGVQ